MRLKQLMVAGLMFAGSGIALADPLVTEWDFQTTTGFEDDGAWSCDGDVAGSNSCSLAFSDLNGNGTYNTLSWGTESNPEDAQSYLEITNILGTLTTNGGWEDINYFDHYNHVITAAGGSLGFVNILGLFQILDPLGVLPDFGTPNGVSFFETFNTQDCPTPNPNGTYCDDIFTTGGLSGSFNFMVAGDGGMYTLSFQFFAGPGTTIVDNGDGTFTIYTTEACSADGIAGCQPGEPYAAGFSRLITQAQITYVAEPAYIALLGFGLLGLFLRRKRF
ncbi:THxN family PEP-CTERM protein [Permianibacter aggregans]|uniref:Putative secreted protein with PEP-CTERM sorting signal n=1 Tax=Permianibacter aggregans TaxID=1510150 RepID=A0A4R6UMJ3_9GAMM|nr:THxN family PEP-CTERM protein [Permianibacter aggregans]QGX38974.1 hypothetical protein E2H98_04580 [Permianibacter aggregans]TDQ46779.1 putative secreted protein with PEP-CTERM sorting signal [Permianibacter aggregans]